MTVANLIAYIRAAPYRPDLGDPEDGPRIGDVISQRVRLPALDPNCVERTLLFLAIAMLLAPERHFSAATMMLDGGLHTFPIELTPTWARPIILDSTAEPLRNLMNAAVCEIRNGSPLAEGQLVPWFAELARNAASSRDMQACHDIAMRALRRALVTGTSIDRPDEVACLLALTAEDAQLFGPLGTIAHQRMSDSIRNLSVSLNGKVVLRYLEKLKSTVEPYAGEVIKAALIAKFGPAAGLALHDADLGVGKLQSQVPTDEQTLKRKLEEERRQRMHRMSPAVLMTNK